MYAMVWSSPNQSPWSGWLCIRTLLQKHSEDIEPDLFFKEQLNSQDQELFLQHLSDRDLKADEYI